MPWAAAGAAGVVLAFAVAGFSWWDALPVLRTSLLSRHRARATRLGYWVWGDLAALCVCAGPVLGASWAAVAGRGSAPARSRDPRPWSALSGAALLCVLLADLSFMSKSEVERIWLPFVPWLLLGTALLSDRWRRRALAGQVALALAVETLLFTHW